MDAGRIRRAPGSGARRGTGVVAAGSVWESRMKLDEVKGGVRVFNGGDGEVGVDDLGEVGVDDLGEAVSDPGGSVEDARKVRKSPIGGSAKRKTWKSETSFEGFEGIKNGSKLRSDSQLHRSSSDSEKTPIPGRRKLRSERSKELGLSLSPVQSELRSGESRKANSVSGDVPVHEIDKDCINNVVDEPERNGDGEIGTELTTGSDVNCKDFGENSTSSNNVTREQPEEDDELEEDEFEDMEEDMVVVDSLSIDDVKEINVPEPNPKKIPMAVFEEKKIGKLNTKPVTMASTVRTQLPPLSPVIRSSTIHQNHQPTKPAPDQNKRFPHTQNKLQSLVDLVMWRDVSRSAFVFGIGSFVIVSSSYTQDLNISFTSVVSYVGLVYLAAIFLYKSIICRGVIDTHDDTSYVVSEGEAVWLLKLFLPYLNESLLKLRALFSGDPSTTMKLAVLLFVLARCGNSITIWKMAKFGFFGIFTLPKVCSSYSPLITAYGKFWVQRFRDAWESCTHKKAVAFGVFTLVWNLSSIVARVWAVFMLFVAIRYYQQSMMARDGWEEEASNATAESEERRRGLRQAQNGGLGRLRVRQGESIIAESNKTKKGS